MKKVSLQMFSYSLFFVLLMAPFTTRAVVPLAVQTETGAQVDKAMAIVKNVKEGEQVAVAQPKDTNFLFTGVPMSSLVIYNTAVSNSFFMVTAFGDDRVEIAAENISEGDFVAVNTTEPDGCTTLTLTECRSNTDYIGETAFSVGVNSSSAQVPVQENSFLSGLGELFGF